MPGLNNCKHTGRFVVTAKVNTAQAGAHVNHALDCAVECFDCGALFEFTGDAARSGDRTQVRLGLRPMAPAIDP